jgi:hypothetical protein
LELAVFVLDLIEQAHILDRECRLVGKVLTSSICFSVNGRTSERVNVRTPVGMPSRNIGTPSTVR